MTDTPTSAPLIVQSLVVIAGSFLVIGALIATCVVAWRQGRTEDRADIDSTRQFSTAADALDRLHRTPGYARRRTPGGLRR